MLTNILVILNLKAILTTDYGYLQQILCSMSVFFFFVCGWLGLGTPKGTAYS